MSTRPADPAAVAPVLLGAMVGALVAGRIALALLCVGVAALAGAWAGAPRPSARWLRLSLVGAIVAVALNAYLIRGRPAPLPTLGAFHASLEGVRLGVLLALRVLGASIAVHGLRAAWPGERAADESARLLAPLRHVRVPVAELRLMLGLALRFAPLLADEARRITVLQELRAGRAPRDWRERLQRRRATLVPTLVVTLERAERVALALEARHYRVRPIAARAPRRWGWTMAGATLAGTALLWR